MKRKVFFSFHYKPDNWRASQVRSIGALEGNEPCSDNDWETVTRGGDAAIENWIAGQLRNRACAVVLVGFETAGRRWITYEINEAWNRGMGVVGIRIDRLKNVLGRQSWEGGNPFDHVHFTARPDKFLSSVVKLHNPPYLDSKQVYAHIQINIDKWIEDAVLQRDNFSL